MKFSIKKRLWGGLSVAGLAGIVVAVWGHGALMKGGTLFPGIGLIVAGIVLFFGGAHLIIRSVTRNLQGLQAELFANSDQVATASQYLAQGAATQSASLEVAVAAMSQMADMVHTNGENTAEAARLVDNSRASMKSSHKLLRSTKDCIDAIMTTG